jgi:hypothetical protein
MGYRLYRALPGAPILVAADPQLPLDAFELNLFAAQSDRAKELRESDCLVDSVPLWEPDKAAKVAWAKVPLAHAHAANPRGAQFSARP